MKYIVSILACICCLATPMPVNAAETEGALSNTASSEEITPAAAGLISSYSLGCSAGTKVIFSQLYNYLKYHTVNCTSTKHLLSSDFSWLWYNILDDKSM